ncbi:hypothetical protein M8A51_07805 [Schlegelella sp. S2-27]|uniref:Uncharacterized protein n=1 Tax=Caldimonas mangrovi TaxID=2944811 RepID=A0ABT0YL25_9BURK|nr:hypothetical protein [Caldimonas mangrovi]MCM5679434.1 hypothetical protein [Caldimonas mangrovi]
MSIPPSFRNWLMAQPGGSTAFRDLVRWTGTDDATCELGDALSQWQLHFVGRGASQDVREALRTAWWRYIESRAASAAAPSTAKRLLRSIERGFAQWAEPAVAWVREPRAGDALRRAPVKPSARLEARRSSS